MTEAISRHPNADDLSDFPFQRRCPFAPPPEYGQLRDTDPVSKVRLPDGSTVWLITRYEDVRTVLTSPAFSADATRPGFPAIQPELRQLFNNPPFVRKDPPQHTLERRALIGEFTVKRMKALRPGIQSTVDQLLDDMLRTTPPVDLVQALALPVPSLVICRLLGVPYADHEFFQSATRTLLTRATTREQFTAAMGSLFGYMNELITQKQRHPTDDLLSRLITGHLEPAGELSRENVLKMCTLLLQAGHETTANMIALGTVTLLNNPDQLAALHADPGLLPGAIEEMLRQLSIADTGSVRIATDDVEISGTTIRAGDGVLALLGAANADPAVFADAETFDLRRGARHHVAFGYGIHQCLGQNLARMELEIVFATLFERVPSLRLATPVTELPYKHDGAYGVYELPVDW
ncbi:cytochrome P450 [Nonomuraea diastatica]|uniref:Cytochrome P450 n=1 Tax=Nonomuraea diastatica TaxID=1848329 RepID=A0A4R4WXY9_9ACTN|nr:cytochrome P450 [Nonomuraea diastatica]TDD22686.1 cytochrome P450 [Nonomuraea diastatica]